MLKWNIYANSKHRCQLLLWLLDQWLGGCTTALSSGLYGGTPDAEINVFGINRSPSKLDF